MPEKLSKESPKFKESSWALEQVIQYLSKGSNPLEMKPIIDKFVNTIKSLEELDHIQSVISEKSQKLEYKNIIQELMLISQNQLANRRAKLEYLRRKK